MSDPSPYGAPRSRAGETAPPSFLERLVQLPFRPALWRASAHFPTASVVLPLLVLVLAADTIIGFLRAGDARDAVYEAAQEYDETADPLVFEGGRFRLDGDRIFFRVFDDTTVLVDPEVTVPDSAIETGSYLIVRADSVTTETRRVGAEQLTEMAGDEPFVIDGATLRELADAVVYPGVLLGVAVVGTGFDLVMCLVYALVAGGILLLVRGQYLGLAFPECYRVALAASAATVVLELILVVSEVGEPVAGILLWPVLMFALGLVALAGAQRPDPLEPS